MAAGTPSDLHPPHHSYYHSAPPNLPKPLTCGVPKSPVVRVGPLQPPVARGGRLVGRQVSYSAGSAIRCGRGNMDEAGPFLLDHHRDECLRPRTAVTLDGHGSGSVEPRGGLVESGRGGGWVVFSGRP